MNYYNDRRSDEEDDNELWDDELDLLSDNDEPDFADDHGHPDNSDDFYSDPEPDPKPEPEPEPEFEPDPEEVPAPKSRRERFFSSNEDDEETDFYNSDIDPEPEPQKPHKVPKLDPEDPDYWIEEDSGLSSIFRTPRKKWKWWLTGVLIVLVLILGAWIWFFRPYVDSAVKYGYIKNMERRGSIVKTFEGSIIPYKELGDPNPLHFEELMFSVESDSLAAVMKRLMLNCVPVRVEYELYHTPLFWKGESQMIIIKADSADSNKILPPEYR